MPLPVTPAEAFQRAMSAYRSGDLGEAERLCGVALGADPKHVDALNVLGAVHLHHGEPARALECFTQAAKLAPRYADAHSNKGVALKNLRRWDEALACYRRALEIDPLHVDALYNRGVVMGELARWREALESYDRVLRIRPDHAPAWNNRGNVLQAQARWEEALQSYDRALRLQPRNADALNNLGLVLIELDSPAQAVKALDAATLLDPQLAEAHWLKSIALLQLGELAQGWKLREWRWRTAERPPDRGFTQPRWTGAERIEGRTLLLHAEEGLGDAIHMARYARLVGERGAKVILEVQPPLARLMESLSRQIAVVARGSPVPPFDLHCALGTLPLAFGTTLDTIPLREAYLRAADADVAAWAARLGPRERPRVGLAWSGNPTHRKDRDRSIPFESVRAILDAPVEFHSVQKEYRRGERDAVAADGRVREWSGELGDFADTAALVANLDVVIAVDTSVAHLAAAMGKPTWILLTRVADYRWLRGRADSPWYPSARLFRQPSRGDWGSVLAQVKAALAALS